MSYNTRRTTGGGVGRGQTTQVNYHQQSRPGTTVTQQSRNPGYTTTSTNYNSSSQPVYSTQQPASYNTAPAPPQQAQAPAAPPTQPPPPSTPAPSLKQEPVTPAQTPTNTETPASENGTGTQPNRPFWKRKPFAKVSNKVKRARKNAKLRRVLNPKNAITFLNELRPGDIKFNVREEAGWGFTASVDIDGKIFSGHALTVSKAKTQASEVALKHILMDQMAKSAAAAAAAADKPETETKQEPDEDMDTEEKEGEGEVPKAKKRKTEEDELPWGSLAAFALHKLFEHWHKEEGAGGDGPMPPSQFKYEEEMTDDESYYRKPGPEFGYPRRPPPGGSILFARGRGFGPYPPRGFMGPRRLPPPPASTFLGNSRQPINIGNAPFPNDALPMRKIPNDANKKNPVMLLNQLKPNVVYTEFQEGMAPGAVFRITVNLDGQEYVGRGKTKKDAKRMAAKAALAPLGVVYEDGNQ